MKVWICSFCAAAALVALSCSSTTLSGPGIQLDSYLRDVVPPTATMLAGVNLKSLKTTQLYSRYAKDLDLSALNESGEKLGFDPRQDVDTLLFESDGQNSLVLATGRFRSALIKEKLGAHATPYKSYSLLENGRNSLALIKDRLAIAGPTSALHSALDNRDAKTGSMPPELNTRLQSISKNSQIWVVSSKGLPLAGVPMRSDVTSALSNIVNYVSGTTAGLEVSDTLKLKASLNCVSPQGAQRVHDALRGAIGLARLTTREDQRDLLKLYDAIEVDQTESSVQVNATLAPEQIDQLTKFLPQLKSRTGMLDR